MLTPLDIHNKEFRRSFRGYEQDEVDAFLDEVVRDFEAVLKERDQLKDTIEQLERQIDQYRLIEDNLQKALVVAQQTAEEVRAASVKEAQLIVEKARQESTRIADEARLQVRQIEERAARMRAEFDVYRAKTRSLLEGQIRLLEMSEVEGEDIDGTAN